MSPRPERMPGLPISGMSMICLTIGVRPDLSKPMWNWSLRNPCMPSREDYRKPFAALPRKEASPPIP